ncbi:MAG: hypoxanthine/guanine phosphoribosyltransferase [Candidatus Methanomethylophilaceae archaeon]
MLERTRASVESSRIISKNGYPYLINPLMDGIPRMDPEILDEVTDRMIQLSDFDCDLILAPEAMALPLAAAVSLKTRIPYCVIRKRPYGCEDEIPIDEVTGYSRNRMYINDISPGERIVIIDDVVSTGGTLRSIVEAVRRRGCVVSDVIVAVNKSKDLQSISETVGVRVKAVIDVRIEGGKAVCTD